MARPLPLLKATPVEARLHELREEFDRVKMGIGQAPAGAGTGDMLAATYDADGDSVVDDSERLGGQLPAYYALASHTHVVSQYTSGSRPAANSSTAGTFIRVKDASSPEELQFCLTTSSGSYEWIIVGIASS